MRVQNKSIIVTGAGNGIGEGIAKRLAEEGASVLVNDINTAGGQRVVAEITAAGARPRSSRPMSRNPPKSRPWWQRPSACSASWTPW